MPYFPPLALSLSWDDYHNVAKQYGADRAQWIAERLQQEESGVPIVAKDTRGEFTAAPEGLHQAVCVDVVDKGLETTKFGTKHMIQLVWQIDLTDDKTGNPMRVYKKYPLSLNERSNLSKDLESWRGRKFTQKERDGGFDVESMIGMNCQVQVVHNITDKGTFANVSSVVPLGKGMTKLVAHEYVRVQDRPRTDEPASANGAETEDADSDLGF